MHAKQFAAGGRRPAATPSRTLFETFFFCFAAVILIYLRQFSLRSMYKLRNVHAKQFAAGGRRPAATPSRTLFETVFFCFAAIILIYLRQFSIVTLFFR